MNALPQAARALIDLTGKTAIVTGAGRGQGALEAELLARCGAHVLICDVLDAEGAGLADSLAAQGL